MIAMQKLLQEDICHLEHTLEIKKEKLRAIEITIMETCKHKWVMDYIDINEDQSRLICYFTKCHLSGGHNHSNPHKQNRAQAPNLVVARR